MMVQIDYVCPKLRAKVDINRLCLPKLCADTTVDFSFYSRVRTLVEK